METFRPTLRFLDAGDGGLVVELGQDIDETTNAAVMALAERLGEACLDGVLEVIPTYRSLLVQFDPLRLEKSVLVGEVEKAWAAATTVDRHASLWHIPVCYGDEYGADLGFVARANGLDEAEVVARHAGATYRIYMIGFAPGFAYLGGLDRSLHTSRRTEPRLKTPPRSISIGGMQTAVSPPPGAWSPRARAPAAPGRGFGKRFRPPGPRAHPPPPPPCLAHSTSPRCCHHQR